MIVENTGLILHSDGTPYKQSVDGRGYKQVRYKDKVLHVHRLVATKYVPNPLNKPCVNHIDGNKLNNNYANLEWCTHAENNRHAFATGLNCGRPKVPVNKYDLNGNLIQTYDSVLSAQSSTGKPFATGVSKCIRGKSKTAYGYYWAYA